MKLFRRKKGFTLVELIVVIAIIAVLAAILVPTMLNIVTKSKVSSANSTATEFQKCTNLLLLQADSVYFGILPSKVIKFDITINTASNQTVWTCSAAQSGTYNNSNMSGITWGTAQTYTVGSNPGSITSGELLVCSSLSSKFPQLKEGSAVIVLSSGHCSYAVFTPDMTTAIPADQYPPIKSDGTPGTFAWNNKSAGISPDGYTIGTAPAVPIG